MIDPTGHLDFFQLKIILITLLVCYSFFDGGNIYLNINGDDKRQYSSSVEGNILRLTNFQMGTIMRLNERDFIKLNNQSGDHLSVSPVLSPFSLTLKRLA